MFLRSLEYLLTSRREVAIVLVFKTLLHFTAFHACGFRRLARVKGSLPSWSRVWSFSASLLLYYQRNIAAFSKKTWITSLGDSRGLMQHASESEVTLHSFDAGFISSCGISFNSMRLFMMIVAVSSIHTRVPINLFKRLWARRAQYLQRRNYRQNQVTTHT